MKEKIGNVEFLIMPIDKDSERQLNGLGYGNTSKTQEKAEELLDVIRNIATGFNDTVSEIRKKSQPDEISLHIKVGLSTKLNMWVINAGANSSVGVNLKWKKSN